MENAFSTDFSHVRIHTGSTAAEMNKEVNAKAFTYGSDIYFNSNQFSPETNSGKHLLAHELTHVVQQTQFYNWPKVQRYATFGDTGGYEPAEDTEYDRWYELQSNQHEVALKEQKSSTIGEDVELTKQIIDSGRLKLFEAVQKIKVGEWADYGNSSSLMKGRYDFNARFTKLLTDTGEGESIALPNLMEKWGYSGAYLETVLSVKNDIYVEFKQSEFIKSNPSNANKEEAKIDEVFETSEFYFSEIPSAILKNLHLNLDGYYNSFEFFANSVNKYTADYKRYADEHDAVSRALLPKAKCNVNHHAVRDFQPYFINYEKPENVLPQITDFHERVFYIFSFRDFDKVNLEFADATKKMDYLFENILSPNSPEMKEREYLKGLLKRQEELMNNRPDAIRIPAVFYPQKEFVDVKKDDGSRDQKAKEIPWLFYLYNTGFNGFDRTANAEGEWVLIDVTTPPPKGKDFVANKKPSQSMGAAFLQQGWRVDPPIELFKALNTKLRFPKGELYWTKPTGGEGSLETTASQSVSEFLAEIGLGLVALGLILLTAGAAAPLVAGAFAASSVFGIASALADWDEKSEHNMNTDDDFNRLIFSIGMDTVSILSLGLGRFASATAKTAESVSKANQLQSLVGRWVVPVVSKIDKGLEVTNLIIITNDFLNQYYAIENSSLTESQKKDAKRKLAIMGLKTAGMIIGPKVIGNYASKRQEFNIDLDDSSYAKMRIEGDVNSKESIGAGIDAFSPLAKQPAANGHEIEVDKDGIKLCSPRPCPLLRNRYAEELSINSKLNERLKVAESKRTSEPLKAAEEARLIEQELLNIQISKIEGEIQPVRQAIMDYRAQREAAGKSLKGGPIKKIWNLYEKIWLLKRQRNHMDRIILEQPHFVGIRNPDGSITPMSQITKKGRRPDYVELYDNKVIAGDLKSQQELLGSVDGGLSPGDGKIIGTYRKSSKIAQQHAIEDKVLATARKKQGTIILRGRDVRSGEIHEIEVSPGDYQSNVLSYKEELPN
ncbi:MAG: DUF4157 domain-containing protein [Ferruginibacter sp.]